MRTLAASIVGRAAIRAVVLLLMLALLPVGQRAAAQTPTANVVGYGRTVTGEVSSPSGSEHYFTGCAGESINITVDTTVNTTNASPSAGFTPRVEIYDLATETSLASAVAGLSSKSVTLAGLELPASGDYVVAVSGRSRADRGRYGLTLDLNLPAGTPPLDGVLTLNLLYGNTVLGTLAPDGGEHWNFRGCDGDEILVEVVADGFVPEVRLFAPVAELPIATATIVTEGDQTVATLSRALPANGEYNLIISGASDTDAGDYTLTFTLANRAAPTPPLVTTPTVTVTPAPTITAGPTVTGAPTGTPAPTRTSGPRGRRGIPTPQGNATPVTVTATPRPTTTPTPPNAVTPTPTLIPTATPTPTPFLPTGQLETFCTVTTDRLNLRPGPGTNFDPPITVLEIGAFMVVTGRNADSSWLQVAVLDDNLAVAYTGWLSAAFVFCVGDLESVPIVEEG